MVCDVAMSLNRENVSLVVPYKAVSKDSDGKTYVFTVSPDGKSAKKQYINTGNYDGSGIEVASGLEIDQMVVCEGADKLSENSLISF